MITITNRAFPDCGGHTVWRPHRWRTSTFNSLFGNMKCRKAKLICLLPFGYGLFFTYGKEWIE